MPSEEYKLILTRGKETLLSVQVTPAKIGAIATMIKALISKKDKAVLKKTLDK